MQFDESPELDQFKDGMPENTPAPDAGRKKFRVILLLTFIVVSLFGVALLLKENRTLATLTGTAVVQGRVVDEDGQPFIGEIFILGTELKTQTDANGNFELRRVPSGEQILIVADELIGRDFSIQVTTATTLEMGEIRFETTAMPPN
ncbi:MAG: carboxypeptidase-like regulatory domain-containing protein [Anaerolineales bacterium]|uniref:carboxypeptidase-like regulatory domain-containing protein n=1 Tax=Candidatus Villigracilis proximus TaxID=3140683 RepID=UPI003136FEC9|nr:carboxypeptidase-like regulatory domain-containing protein [Anaerolineales bacterium]MBK9210832.1 carboxypeptidase-like regulatory domain-containing protein [Anaerolineales bacterium]